jgi:Type I phosphodiesterase / nucleotide pyrophosphatase
VTRKSRPGPLVVVSVDGMRPDAYRRTTKLALRLPNILDLVATGASADAVESIYPSTTYPAHATLVTGVPPRNHGIYSHLASLDPTESARPWHWFAKALRVPALWDSARALGIKTASIGWPVSAGAPIDYNIPEIWDPALPDPLGDFQTVVRHATPGLVEEVLRELAPTLPDVVGDNLRTGAAIHIWKKFHPQLLLLHLVDYDHAAHHYGPFASQSIEALEKSDAEIGRLRGALDGHEPVTLVVLSDHGFVPVEKDAAPFVLFGEEGLFVKVNETEWELRRLGAVNAGGSLALYWLEKPSTEDRRALDRALERLRETGAAAESVDGSKLEELSADPDASVIIDAAQGHFFSDRFDGPLVRPSVEVRGTHGNLPGVSGLEASFVASGPGIARGRNLGRLKLIQVGRSLIELLGLPPETLASDVPPPDLG